MTELLEIVGKAELLPDPDAPLGGIILVPLNGIAVVGGKLMVEVMVSLTESDNGRQYVVARRITVVEGLLSDPVGERVDAESGLLDEENAEDAGVNETAKPVIPTEAADSRGEDKRHSDNGLQIVLVLPDYNGILVQICDIGAAHLLGVLLENHPANVRVEEALANRVGVLLGVRVSMVSTVAMGPPPDGPFDGTGTHGGQVNFERQGCFV